MTMLQLQVWHKLYFFSDEEINTWPKELVLQLNRKLRLRWALLNQQNQP